VQQAFIDASTGLPGLREPSDFRSWLVKITVRRVNRRGAKQKRQLFLAGAIEQVSARASDPMDLERVDDLYESLRSLPANLSEPWVLHEIEGETLPEVARRCETSLATTKRRIARAESHIVRKPIP
jgi:RNA polymerase sigma factor (sigma-70 family)